MIYLLIFKASDHWKRVGTPGYRSHGVLFEKTYIGADRWSLILTTYFMVVGKRMFANDAEAYTSSLSVILKNISNINASDNFKKFIKCLLIICTEEINNDDNRIEH